MGQYCFARWRLSSVVVVYNDAGGRAGLPQGAWAVGRAASQLVTRCVKLKGQLVTCGELVVCRVDR